MHRIHHDTHQNTCGCKSDCVDCSESPHGFLVPPGASKSLQAIQDIGSGSSEGVAHQGRYYSINRKSFAQQDHHGVIQHTGDCAHRSKGRDLVKESPLAPSCDGRPYAEEFAVFPLLKRRPDYLNWPAVHLKSSECSFLDYVIADQFCNSTTGSSRGQNASTLIVGISRGA